jgi:hypothetical protein
MSSGLLSKWGVSVEGGLDGCELGILDEIEGRADEREGRADEREGRAEGLWEGEIDGLRLGRFEGALEGNTVGG